MTNHEHKKPWHKKPSVVIPIVIALFILGGIITLMIASSINAAKEKAKLEAKDNARKVELLADPSNKVTIYSAVNKLRSSSGASALGLNNNMVTAADQACNDIAHEEFTAFLNNSNRDMNIYITNNQGNLYLGKYIGFYFYTPLDKTSTESVKEASNSNAYLVDPEFTIVGWSTCKAPAGGDIAVGMMAQEKERPAPVYQAPTYRPYSPTYCSTNYYSYTNSSSTTCY